MTFNSSSYWNDRYVGGGNSGAGSYGRLAKFKAKILNKFVAKNSITTVLEIGVGDGNQLSLSKYPKYVGADVSPKAIEICRQRFKDDGSKRFMVIGAEPLPHADLVISLDVVFHLVENSVFEEYMKSLFSHSKKYVVIYSSNRSDSGDTSEHVKHRNFTDWVSSNFPQWKLTNTILNKYPFDPSNPNETSFSDFYFYEISNY